MAAPGAAAAALVQYVVLRGDLARPPLSWPLGAVVAQACHAALAAVHTHRQHPDTGAYLEQGGAMRTVVLEHDIDHEVWTEQPENVATCLALRPYPKERVHQHLKKFKLLK
ncbi:hypothetical protein Q9233_017381 [Columba guinea]|nr:hypothetical protein Q9233_017381 [Columba guinea]